MRNIQEYPKPTYITIDLMFIEEINVFGERLKHLEDIETGLRGGLIKVLQTLLLDAPQCVPVCHLSVLLSNVHAVAD
jgi:hypothetical protein